MPKQWKSGDKVRLPSGGPDMTVKVQVSKEFEGEIVVCQWFDREGQLQNGEFAPDQLIDAK
jgi:uncharacterized protein YodC (DUF2158 family)